MKRNILFSTTGWKSHLSREKAERIAADNSKEEKTNKVITSRSNPDNNHYPSEKLMHDSIANTKAELNERCNAEEQRARKVEEEILSSIGHLEVKEAIFSHRPTGGDIPVVDGSAKIKSIKGYTLLWNQYAGIVDSQTTDNTLIASKGDGSYIVQTAVDETAGSDISVKISENISGCNGHKLLFYGAPKGSSSASYCLYAEKSGQCDTGDGCIIESAQDGESFAIRVSKGTNINREVIFTPQIFDLTKMFGWGNEPASVEKFRALFPLPLYEYCSGKLVSLKACDIKTTSFNQFNGRYAAVLAHRPYYLGGTYRSIGFSQQRSGDATPFTIPRSRIYIPATNGYIHATGENICINFSDENRNGEYSDYIEYFNPLPVETYFPDGMKSVGSVYDEMTEDKIITRIATRAYASGDESNATVITDGKETYYVKESEAVTAPDTAPSLSYTTKSGGTEEVIYTEHSTPMRADIVYPFNVQESIKENRKTVVALTKRIAELEAMINAASIN